MYRRVAQRLTLQTAIAFTICIALLPIPGISLLISGIAQGPPQGEARKGNPKPGRPEGILPNLEEAKNESGIEREAAPPIPSTMRSPKAPLQPWDGKRVGDPGTQGTERGNGRSMLAARIARAHKTKFYRAHARMRIGAPPPVLDDQFVQNFFNWVVLRVPYANESTFWNDQFRVAYAQGQTSVMLAGVALGKTLFESAEYAARNRNDHWYVYDLYKTFLMRDPDASGWAYWESVVPINGRENVRRAFEVCPEFAAIVASIVPNGSATANAASLVSARVDPSNQPGNGMLTRDVSWNVPLLSLPGRAGLDLGLALSYSSMVWTRSGPYMHFDEDNGFPSPGFRLGFPIVQRKVFDAQTAKNVYLLITPAGRRVELRQVGSSNIYEAADSSYLQLTDNSSYLAVRSTDGTQLSFAEINNEFSCTQVKDRNGNYIAINHNSLGRISTITDTLGRVITFNYDGNANLISITQAWNGQPSHQWVSFGWGTRTMQSSFSDSTLRGIIGTANGVVLPVLTRVNLNDTSYFTFDYTNSLQVSAIRNYFDTTERNATTFTYETPAGDTPRLLDSRVSALNWTGINGVPSQVITTYSVDANGACVMTTPDGTVYKESYGSGWQRGLTVASEVKIGNQVQKSTTTTWTQDNISVGYEVNPRVTETNVYDAAGNRRRTTISYYPTSYFSLPSDVYEYAADAITVLRRTHTNYNFSSTYTDRRIIGLPTGKYIFDGNDNLYQFDCFEYDYGGSYLIDTPQTPTQHDGSYGVGFVAGRGNLSAIRHTNANDPVNNPVHDTLFVYNKTGSVTSVIDPMGHTKSFSYVDSFSDNVNRNTFAYPTTITDADGFSSYVQYNFDLGATTRTQSPTPAGQSYGAIQTMTYNNLGQLERVTTTNNGAYTRYVYGGYYVQSFATVNNVADEAYSCQVFDGLGRVTGSSANHPGSTGGYRAQNTVYDTMGRTVKVSNPTEITGTWVAIGDDVAGWLYTQQSYDWKGRPLVTTNTDGTTKEASYAGCGCAGGTVVTLTDEGTIDAGVMKRRQQKIYSDVLGRVVKTEILNWQNGSVYSATVNTYNARDQLTQIRQYAGPEGSGSYQDTAMTYDGYGRLKTKHVPEQNIGSTTNWTYNADDTVQSITDARGASTTFTYTNGRHLPNVVTHTLAGSSTIVESFAYDGAGNRTSMSDSSGGTTYQYNQLSQLTSETRSFTGLAGSYTLGYDYHVNGQLKHITDHTNQRISYSYDSAGRLSAVSGTNYSYGLFIDSITYRAWGLPRQIAYGNGRIESVTYNARLRANHYEIPTGGGFGPAVSIDYQYYNDGRLKYSHDLLDNRLDRKYEYDHVARLTKALSGAEARGEPATNNRPYKETATYDAFNHLNVRTSRHWSRQFGFASSDTYSNNRRVGWTYDAEGRWLSGGGRQHTYDAAGRRNATSWTGGYFNEFYDGDGRRVKAVEPNMVTYYLRSTVLGGQVIEELNSSGTKQKSLIYGGKKVIGYDWAGGNVSMLHEDPSGLTVHSSAPPSPIVINFAELDPWGAEVFDWDPYVGDPEFSGGRGESGPVYPGYGDISMPSTACMLDGAYTLCDFVTRNREALAVQITVGGKAKVVPLTPVLLGVFAYWVEDAGRKLDKPQTPVDSEFEVTDVIVTNIDDDSLGHWELINLGSSQDTGSPIPARNLLAEVFHLLDNNRCFTFIANLLNVARQLTRRKPYTYDAYELAITIATRQPEGGVTFPGGGDGGGDAFGDIFSGTAKAGIYLRRDGPGVSRVGVQVFYALVALHEFIHLAGGANQNGLPVYTDYTLAEAAKIYTGAPGYPSGPAPTNREEQDKLRSDSGDYWDNQLWEYCNPLGARKR